MPTGSGSSAIGGSMSTSSPKLMTGWHVFKIERYSKTAWLPAGRSIKSSTFTVGGHTWYIRYFPGGIDAKDWQGSIGVDLNLHRPAATGEVLTEFKFSMLNQAGEPVQSSIHPGFAKFTREKDSHRFSWLKKWEINSLCIKGDDSFKIRCDVTVVKDIDAEDNTVEAVTVPPPDLHCHLGDLLDTQVGGDVTFKVSGKIFTAHRNILATRSSVFMAQLFGQMKEKTASHVCIDDMDARVFKAMLHFIYTDMLPDMEENEKTVMSQHLLVAADRYNMERLKLICEEILRKRINTEIVATTLVLAEQHGCCGLKKACFKFLMSPGNLKTVMASDSFQRVKNSCPSLLDELLVKVAP